MMFHIPMSTLHHNGINLLKRLVSVDKYEQWLKIQKSRGINHYFHWWHTWCVDFLIAKQIPHYFRINMKFIHIVTIWLASCDATFPNKECTCVDKYCRYFQCNSNDSNKNILMCRSKDDVSSSKFPMTVMDATEVCNL